MNLEYGEGDYKWRTLATLEPDTVRRALLKSGDIYNEWQMIEQHKKNWWYRSAMDAGSKDEHSLDIESRCS